MDVIIPAHNLKTLSSSLATLSKIGKHLYIEFDPLAGLTFRTLNDAKNAFAQFHFDVGFFERCSSPPGSRLRRRVREDSNGTAGRRRKRDKTQSQDDDDEKYLCRVLIRTVAAILRSRKGLQSVRIRSLGSTSMSQDDDDDENHDEGNDLRMQLSFEFRIQSEGIMRITHKVGVSEAQSVVAEASRTGCSEIVAAPRVLLKMIDPVQSTEVALIISDVEKRVTATSFHYADAAASKNLVLSASAATVLKTETSIDIDEFDDFVFSDGNGEEIPKGCDKEVALVFSTKEAKAMIQFCAQANIDDELKAIVSFHYGGRPIIIETEGDAFKAELILATVAHGLLNGVDLTSRGQKKNNRSRTSTGTGSLSGANRSSS